MADRRLSNQQGAPMSTLDPEERAEGDRLVPRPAVVHPPPQLLEDSSAPEHGGDRRVPLRPFAAVVRE